MVIEITCNGQSLTLHYKYDQKLENVNDLLMQSDKNELFTQTFIDVRDYVCYYQRIVKR